MFCTLNAVFSIRGERARHGSAKQKHSALEVAQLLDVDSLIAQVRPLCARLDFALRSTP